MDNTNMIKDAVETPADKKPAESIAATSTTSTTGTTNLAPSANHQSAKPESEATEFAKADDTCAAKEGDTLLTIANRHKASLALLKALNGIDDALKQLDKDKLIKLK